MNKTIFATIIALVLILGVGFISAVVYTSQNSSDSVNDNRVRVVYSADENSAATAKACSECACANTNCFAYPTVEQEVRVPCEKPRRTVCNNGCYEGVAQEKGNGYHQNIPQEKKTCDN